MMRNAGKCLWLTAMCCGAGWQVAFCQISDTVTLIQVVVSDTRPPDRNEYVFYDSLDFQTGWFRTLTDIVTKKTGIYIRSYGPGGLSSISLRGSSASQSVVRFNDVPLNSNMNGQVDLNLVPLAMAEEVSVVSSNMMEYGSGGLGGELHINSSTDWKKGLSTGFGFEVGSFSTYKTFASLNVANNKLQSKTKVFYHRAKNDFPFKNITRRGSPEQKQEYAAFETYSGTQELSWKINGQHQLRATGLVTIAHREIPPTMLTVNQREAQDDRLGVGALQWLFLKKRHRLETSFSYKYEYFRYTNEANEIDDTSKSSTWIFTSRYRVLLHSKLKMDVRFQSENQKAITDNYVQSHFRSINGLFVKTEYTPAWFAVLGFSLKQDLNGKKFTPFLPAVQLRIIPFKKKNLFLDGSASINFHLPTFNDLYWSPGGNSDLMNEKSYNTEGSISGNTKSRNGKIEVGGKVSGYWFYIKNKILWRPATSSYWSPVNLSTVISRGTEAEISFQYMQGKWKIGFSGNYHFNKTTDVSNDLDATKDKQLIYVPQHLGNIAIKAGYGKYRVSYSHHFTGLRYTDAQNIKSVEGYSTGELLLTSAFKIQKHLLTFHFRIENIWDESYQDFAWRALPGRAFFGGIKYDFINP